MSSSADSVAASTSEVASSSMRSWGIAVQGARDRDSLTLTSRNELARFAHHRVETVRKRAKPVAKLRTFQCPDHPFVVSNFPGSKGHVLAKRAVDQDNALRHNADAVAPSRRRLRRPIDQNRPRIRLQETKQDIDKGALPPRQKARQSQASRPGGSQGLPSGGPYPWHPDS